MTSRPSLSNRIGFWRAVASLVAMCAATGVAAQGYELGEAPRRFESQDTSGWVYRDVPKANTRSEVVELYQNTYVPGDAVALAWNGSVASCDPGTTNPEHQQAVVTRINYFRALAGLPGAGMLGTTETAQVQAAALMMSANNALSHTPPMSWMCYSATGASGALSANIALGVRGVAAVDLFMDDPGPGNTPTGHRRWLFFPPRSAYATGDVNGGNMPPRPANAVYVFGPQTVRPATPNGIAWPPAGYVPYQNLPSKSNRWSLSYPNADFSAATVTMTGPSGAIPVTLEAVATGFGDNTIVFLPQGISYAKPSSDTAYHVVVSGIGGAGVPSTLQYTVTVIDPDVVAEANYQGLWWNPGETGWGINLAHQGDQIYLTWYTYDATGKALWLAMLAAKTPAGTYTGDILELRGPPFSAIPFAPAPTVNVVGNGTLRFFDANNGSFAYTYGEVVAQTKAITRFMFGPQPTCTFAAAPSFAAATNYQDLWWNAAESGWGINLSHQGSLIYATWYTYDVDGTPLWLASLMNVGAGGVYSGDLLRLTGPAFFSDPFAPPAHSTTVGTAMLTFANGNSATWNYSVGAVSGVKSMTRFLFAPPAGTICQ